MALQPDDVKSIVSRYARGSGESIAALAEAYGVSDGAVRYHLKRAGVLGPDGPRYETDAELGIGEDEAPAGVDLAALLKNPAFAKLVDAAIAARLGQSAGPAPTAEFQKLADAIRHQTEVMAQQQPGYIKPLSVEEVDRRANAYVEMRTLLKRYQAEDDAPLYTLGENGMFECTNAIELKPGSQIRTYLPPTEDSVPENEPARKVYEQMLIWIGGRTADIGEQVEAAMREANQAPLISGALQPVAQRGRVELVAEPPAEPKPGAKPKRVMGTIVPEHHGVSHGGPPTGPQFVGAQA